MEYGIQMFSLRDLTAVDFEKAIREVAEMGYSHLEYAGFFGTPAETVREWQTKYGLTCSGTHTGVKELLPEVIEKTIAYHKIIGCSNIIVPGADLSTLQKIDDFCKIMNNAKKRLAEENISLGYHNHSAEFEIRPWGSTIHSELELRGNFDFEIDTYWAFNAGVDPVQLLERLKSRIKVIHLKDGLKGGIGKALGEGEAPVKAVISKAKEMGVRVVVESEGLNPTGTEEVRRCIDYLKKQVL